MDRTAVTGLIRERVMYKGGALAQQGPLEKAPCFLSDYHRLNTFGGIMLAWEGTTRLTETLAYTVVHKDNFGCLFYRNSILRLKLCSRDNSFRIQWCSEKDMLKVISAIGASGFKIFSRECR